MKKNVGFLLVTSALMLALVTSCKKKEEEQAQLDSQTEQFNDDANRYKANSDEADSDVNDMLDQIPGFGRGAGIASSPFCGVTVDSSGLDSMPKFLVFNFDGTTECFSPSRTRSGAIKVQLTSGISWDNAGAVLTITYINFKVTRSSDGKSIKFNGVKTRKNINGHSLGFWFGQATLKYQDRAFNIAVEFHDGATATWNAAHVTEWNYSPQGSSSQYNGYAHITFSAIGDTSLNSFSQVSSWGTNRFGNPFTTYYNSSIGSNTYCGLWRPVAGELVHNLPSGDFTLTLGVNQSGNASTVDCAYGYKASWTDGNGTQSVVLSY